MLPGHRRADQRFAPALEPDRLDVEIAPVEVAEEPTHHPADDSAELDRQGHPASTAGRRDGVARDHPRPRAAADPDEASARLDLGHSPDRGRKPGLTEPDPLSHEDRSWVDQPNAGHRSGP